MRTLPVLPDPYRQWFLSGTDSARVTALDGPMPNLAADPKACPTCRGTGSFRFYAHFTFGPFESGQEIVDYACPCRDQALLGRWFRLRGIERRVARYYIGDLADVESEGQVFFYSYLDKMESYLRLGRGVLLQGKRGNGKSLIASLLLKQAAKRGRSVYWATFTGLLNQYAAGFDSREDNDWFENWVCKVDLLVIDDLGREYEKRAITRSALDHVLHTRNQAGLATIVTTNLRDEEIVENYDKEIASRLRESCTYLHLTGGDWRDNYDKLVTYEIENDISRPYTFGSF